MKGSSSQPPELPEPEVEYRRPAWVEPPADVVPGIVPVELILARTPQRAIGLTGIRAYPTGFSCTRHPRLREVIPGEQSNFGAFNMFGNAVDPAGEFADYYLRFGVGCADGRKATNLDHRRDLDEVPAPDPPTHPAASPLGGLRPAVLGRGRVGVGPAPARAAGLRVRVACPGHPGTRVEIDAGLVLEAAGRAVPVWPAG
jgi:hypothetical protein